VLTAAALVVVVVGSLALTSTLTLNVIQRTREIGVLGAIGATPRTIASHVWFEAMVFGLLSWAVANLIALPSSWLLESVTGRIFFGSPLDFRLSPMASALWLLLVVVLATVSSVYPAQRAARLSVREALAHV
jgi:putative ABC transport system permease protein